MVDVRERSIMTEAIYFLIGVFFTLMAMLSLGAIKINWKFDIIKPKPCPRCGYDWKAKP